MNHTGKKIENPKAESKEKKLKQDIIVGRKITLYGKDCQDCEVEGYDIGTEYEVDEVRVRPIFGVQIFLKGNIHSYPIEAFCNPKERQMNPTGKKIEKQNKERAKIEKAIKPIGEKMNYTRESLIDICERAIVSEKDWSDRDSSAATRQLGELWALLKSDCKFKVVTSGSWKTDDRTIVVEVHFSGFMSFEIGEGHETETFYLPTGERLKEVNGKDWY